MVDDCTINEILEILERDYPDYIVWTEPFPGKLTNLSRKDVRWVPCWWNIKTNEKDMMELNDSEAEAFEMLFFEIKRLED